MSPTETQEQTLPELVGNLFQAALALVRSAARMFGFELREVTRRIGRRVALFAVSSILAAAGLLLLLGAVALLAEQLLHVPLWAALAVVGAATAALGAVGMRVALRRLGDADLAFPGTVAEIDKDIDALARRGGDEP